jgi:hypothetical protein
LKKSAAGVKGIIKLKAMPQLKIKSASASGPAVIPLSIQ